MLEAVGIKGGHVARKHEINELPHRFPLLLGTRMQCH
jgi:hypothetical protein